MKLTKTQTANLTAIWTTKVAYGATNGGQTVRMGKGQCVKAGFKNMNFTSSSSLVAKGLARVLTTLMGAGVDGYRVQVLVLTQTGREALGV